MSKSSHSLHFRLFKFTVYALLTFNILLFFIHGTLHEAIDSLGWVILLATFEYESTSLEEVYSSHFEKWALFAVQCLGYGLAMFATWRYIGEGEWVDVLNSVTWLLVCAVLAYDVYSPGDYDGFEWKVRNGIKTLLYTILVAVAVWWGYEGLQHEAGLVGLLDFYDAALWIACFAVIELNVFDFERPEETTASKTA
ncbi:hypothetical protein [Aestuariivirga sp.]|uniref:hypothetical protein n=1 Tax=Aestuariivirga sp. TaxID=2650926 RepID=UPI0025BD5EB0|nr:hypothetical protein [Aestuariivirga sp.]MCA3555405.1 hypothetical protein [Aestuariivirga sp.]